MRTDLTEVVLVVDRSGSMLNIKDEAENAVNLFIKEQRKDNDVLLTLVQFDNRYEIVHNGSPIKSVPKYSLKPRSMTALYDAIGRTINDVGDRLSETPEKERPGLVIVAICTDGYENASRKFTNVEISEMIKRQEEKYNWQFIYLGANQDAMRVGRDIGINVAANYSGEKIVKALEAVTSNTRSMKSQLSAGEFVVNKKFTKKQLREMV